MNFLGLALLLIALAATGDGEVLIVPMIPLSPSPIVPE